LYRLQGPAINSHCSIAKTASGEAAHDRHASAISASSAWSVTPYPIACSAKLDRISRSAHSSPYQAPQARAANRCRGAAATNALISRRDRVLGTHPDLHDALEKVAAQGWAHVVLDGKVFRTDRCAETTRSTRSETINA
jgi:hypothetical protein